MEHKYNLLDDWAKYIERKKKEPTGPGFYINGVWHSTSYQDKITHSNPDVEFFEWSDLNSKPRTFRFLKELFPFFDENGIVYTENQVYELEKTYTKRYATCKKGSKEIQFAYDLDTLARYAAEGTNDMDYYCKTMVDKRKAEGKFISNKPEAPQCPVVPITTPNYSHNRYPYDDYGDGDYWEGYYD